ncbi:hypothetical protein EMCRGX_G027359 [Ephydatia muelleri]
MQIVDALRLRLRREGVYGANVMCANKMSWKNLQSLVATTGRLAHRTNVHPRYPYWHRRQFLSVLAPVVQSKEAGRSLQRRRLHAETDHKPRYPPRTFGELMAWSHFILQSKGQIIPTAPASFTLLTKNIPIMVDARANTKTLTWPADPFDSAHFDLNTTAYFNYEPKSKSLTSTTCRLYTPAFQQYATPTIQRYLLAVVEQGTGTYVVKFVNESTPIASAGIYTDIILKDYQSENTGSGIPVSMHIINKDKKPVYLSPSATFKVVTTSNNPATFVMTFY